MAGCLVKKKAQGQLYLGTAVRLHTTEQHDNDKTMT